MCIWIEGGRVPVTGMLAGMNLSKPGMNLSKPGQKHNNHVIMIYIYDTLVTLHFNQNDRFRRLWLELYPSWWTVMKKKTDQGSIFYLCLSKFQVNEGSCTYVTHFSVGQDLENRPDSYLISTCIHSMPLDWHTESRTKQPPEIIFICISTT